VAAHGRYRFTRTLRTPDVRVYRGRKETVAADRAVTDRFVERVATESEPAVRVWQPHRQVAFGRRDANAAGYDRARELAGKWGFPTVEREVGGRAVAYTGRTVAFARAVPLDDPRTGLGERYDAVLGALERALADLGVETSEGEPPDSFCPGSHSLRTAVDGTGRKLVGLAQRVRTGAAVVAGILVVADHAEIADVLAPVYRALSVSFDPETVGSVALAGGETDPERVVECVERVLVGDAPVTVVSV